MLCPVRFELDGRFVSAWNLGVHFGVIIFNAVDLGTHLRRAATAMLMGAN